MLDRPAAAAMLRPRPPAARSSPPSPPAPGRRRRPSGAAGAAILCRRGACRTRLPAPALFQAVPALRPPFGGATHLLVGFGDRAYLQAEGWAAAEGLAALLGGGPGALLVTGLSVPPGSAFPAGDVVAIPADAAAIAGAAGFIAAAFEPDSAGRPRLLRQGPYAGSLFYGAVAPYYAGYTCNT